MQKIENKEIGIVITKGLNALNDVSWFKKRSNIKMKIPGARIAFVFSI